MPNLSKVSKLDGIKSWSLPAGKTCPGSRNKRSIVEVCSHCYAKTGNYRFANVKIVRERNMRDWRKVNFVKEMVTALAGEKYFRWFDSGDCYSPELAKKIYAVVKSTPKTKHWISTRMHKDPGIGKVLKRIDKLANAMVRYSSDNYGAIDKQSRAVVSAEGLPQPGYKCPATWVNADHKCQGCRACWNKKIPLVCYRVHTKGAEKAIRTILERRTKC